MEEYDKIEVYVAIADYTPEEEESNIPLRCGQHVQVSVLLCVYYCVYVTVHVYGTVYVCVCYCVCVCVSVTAYVCVCRVSVLLCQCY